jgi:hypothetical protein
MAVPSPVSILRDALKAVPELKWALGVAGMVAIIAIAKVGWKVDPMIAALGTVVMFVLMVVLVIFARLSTATTIEFRWAILVFMWASLCLTIAAASLLFTSAFFSWPLNFIRDPKYPAIAGGYRPAKGDPQVWDLEDQVNTLRGQWETVSYFGQGKMSQEVLEQATKLQQALLSIDDSKLGPSGHLIKREYACYASIMAATTDPNLNRRVSFSGQAIDLCRQASDDHAYIEANKSKNSNLTYVASWATRVDERPFATYLLALAYCVNGVSANNEGNKDNAIKTLEDVPDYYLARYPPSHDWVLKQCNTDDSQKEAMK